MKLALRLAGALFVVVLTVGLAAGPASAHAELVSTEPGSGEVLDSPPEEVVLRFSEAVDVPSDALKIFDGEGEAVEASDAAHPEGDSKSVASSVSGLEDGLYVVTWHVISADSHPIQGGFTFRVGEAGDATSNAEAEELMQQLLAGEGGDKTVGFVFGVVRFLSFVGIIGLVGGALFLLALWPGGFEVARVLRLLRWAGLTAAVTTVLSIVLQGPYATGEGLAKVFDPSLIGEVLETRAGRVWLLRLVLLAFFAGVLRLKNKRATAGLGVATLATISLAGHAGSGDWVPLAMVVDIVHLSAVSFWLGGLALLSLVVLWRREDSGDDSELERIVRAFSKWASIAVAAIVVTGVTQGLRQTQGIDALGSTTYGRVLLVKVGVVAWIMVAAATSRLWVQQRWVHPVEEDADAGDDAEVEAEVAATGNPGNPGNPGPSRPRLAVLRRSVAAEALIAVVVLAVTAVLVNTVPGVDSLNPTFSTEVHGTNVFVRVTVDPAKAGRSEVVVETMTHGGDPLPVEELEAGLSLPSRDIGPLTTDLQLEGENRYRGEVDIPYSGTWRLDLAIRVSEFDQDDLPINVEVR